MTKGSLKFINNLSQFNEILKRIPIIISDIAYMPEQFFDMINKCEKEVLEGLQAIKAKKRDLVYKQPLKKSITSGDKENHDIQELTKFKLKEFDERLFSNINELLASNRAKNSQEIYKQLLNAQKQNQSLKSNVNTLNEDAYEKYAKIQEQAHELEAQKMNFDKTIVELKKQISQLSESRSNQIKNYTSSIANLNDKIAKLTANVSILNKTKAEIEEREVEENLKHMSDIKNFQQIIKKLEQTNKRFQETNKDLLVKILFLENEKKEAIHLNQEKQIQERIKSLDHIRQLQSKIEELENKNAGVQQKLTQEGKYHQKYTLLMDQFNHQKNISSSQKSQLQKLLDIAQGKINSANQSLQQLKKQTELRIQEKETQINNLKQIMNETEFVGNQSEDIDNLKAKINSLNCSLNQSNALSQKQQKMIAQSQLKITELEEKYAKVVESRKTQIQSNKFIHQNQLQEKSNQLKQAKSILQKQQIQNQKLNDELKGLLRQKEENKTVLHNLSEFFAVLYTNCSKNHCNSAMEISRLINFSELNNVLDYNNLMIHSFSPTDFYKAQKIQPKQIIEQFSTHPNQSIQKGNEMNEKIEICQIKPPPPENISPVKKKQNAISDEKHEVKNEISPQNLVKPKLRTKQSLNLPSEKLVPISLNGSQQIPKNLHRPQTPAQQESSSIQNNPDTQFSQTNGYLAAKYHHLKREFQKMSEYICYLHNLSTKWKKFNLEKQHHFIKINSFAKLNQRLTLLITIHEKSLSFDAQEFVSELNKIIVEAQNYVQFLDQIQKKQVCKYENIIPLVRIKSKLNHNSRKDLQIKSQKQKFSYSQGDYHKDEDIDHIDVSPYDYDEFWYHYHHQPAAHHPHQQKKDIGSFQHLFGEENREVFSEISSVKNQSQISQFMNSRSEFYNIFDYKNMIKPDVSEEFEIQKTNRKQNQDKERIYHKSSKSIRKMYQKNISKVKTLQKKLIEKEKGTKKIIENLTDYFVKKINHMQKQFHDAMNIIINKQDTQIPSSSSIPLKHQPQEVIQEKKSRQTQEETTSTLMRRKSLNHKSITDLLPLIQKNNIICEKDEIYQQKIQSMAKQIEMRDFSLQILQKAFAEKTELLEECEKKLKLLSEKQHADKLTIDKLKQINKRIKHEFNEFMAKLVCFNIPNKVLQNQEASNNINPQPKVIDQQTQTDQDSAQIETKEPKLEYPQIKIIGASRQTQTSFKKDKVEYQDTEMNTDLEVPENQEIENLQELILLKNIKMQDMEQQLKEKNMKIQKMEQQIKDIKEKNMKIQIMEEEIKDQKETEKINPLEEQLLLKFKQIQSLQQEVNTLKNQCQKAKQKHQTKKKTFYFEK